MWGIMSPVSKGLLAGGLISGTALADMRMITGTILFWLVSLFIKKETIDRGDYLKLIGAAFFSSTLTQILFVNGVARTSPVDASICTSSLPIWTVLLSMVFKKEELGLKTAGGIATGLCGSLLLILNGAVNNSSGSSDLIGDIMCLGSQISYAVYLVCFQDIIKKYSPATLMKWKYLFGAMMLLPFSLMTLVEVNWSAFTMRNWGALAYILFFGTFLSYLMVPIGQKALKPTIVAMYNYLQPVSAAIVCVLAGIESFSMTKLIALVMIFLGVAMISKS